MGVVNVTEKGGKMKKKLLRLLSASVMSIFCFSSVFAYASTIYQVTPKDKIWKSMSLEEKLDKTQIEDSKLSSMSDTELIEAIKEYPFLIDLLAFNSMEEGLKRVTDECDAYRELIRRKNGALYLYRYIEQLHKQQENNIKEDGKGELLIELMSALLLYQPEFVEESKILDYSKIERMSPVSETNGVPLYKVYTPKGTGVTVIKSSCQHSAASHDAADREMEKTYNVTRVSRGTCTYNCHSYAWYSQSASNPYWMNNPSPYLTDGSYHRILSGLNSCSDNAKNGDRVIWGSATGPEHSAVLKSPATGEPIATRIVYSKWGQCGVFRHQVATSPYKKNVSVWSR
jgi:hypothetical protein